MDFHRNRPSRSGRDLASSAGVAEAPLSRSQTRRRRAPVLPRRKARPTTSQRVLLVEDNVVNADMLSRRLVRRGFVVLLAGDGLVAVDLAEREQPDIILMDISLPTIDGLDATQRLKANAGTAAIPVIALTAHAMVSDRERCLAAGCQEFETKPIDIERLVAKMRALLTVSVSA